VLAKQGEFMAHFLDNFVHFGRLARKTAQNLATDWHCRQTQSAASAPRAIVFQPEQ
jgi:hypothetical protein